MCLIKSAMKEKMLWIFNTATKTKASLLYFYRINLNSKNYSLYVVERVGFVPFYCHDSNSSGLKIYLS